MATLKWSEFLVALSDPQVVKKTLQRSDEMVFIAIGAVISGAQGWSDRVEFAQTREDWLGRFVRLENGIRVDDTFARMWSVLSRQGNREPSRNSAPQDSKKRPHRRIQGIPHVRIVRDGAHQGHAAGGLGFDTLGDELAGVDQEAGGDAFVEAVALEVVGALGDLHQFFGGLGVDAGFVGDDVGFDGGFGVV